MIVSAFCTTIDGGNVKREGDNILGSFVYNCMGINYVRKTFDVFDDGFYSIHISGLDIGKIYFLLHIK